MNYLFKQRYSLPEGLIGNMAQSLPQSDVVIAESDPETAAMYARHLDIEQISVYVCSKVADTAHYITHLKPQVLVINPGPNLVLSYNMIKQSLLAHESLSVITIGTFIPDEYLDRLMGLGVVLHINRSLSHPRDLLVAVKQMLH